MTIIRRYPNQPVVGVGAVVWHEDAVLLVRRAQEPAQGQWSLPGGTVEVGETLVEALQRELREETGIEVEVLGLTAVLDRIFPDPEGRVQYHYVLVDFLCRYASGVPRAASDISALAFVPLSELDRYHLPPRTRAVINRAWDQWREGGALPLL